MAAAGHSPWREFTSGRVETDPAAARALALTQRPRGAAQFNTGCTTVGVCGKTPEAAAIQDLIVHTTRGISELAVLSAPNEKTNRCAALRARLALPRRPSLLPVPSLVREALFSTLTNVNFDVEALAKYTNRLVEARDLLRCGAAPPSSPPPPAAPSPRTRAAPR